MARINDTGRYIVTARKDGDALDWRTSGREARTLVRAYEADGWIVTVEPW